MTGERSGTGDPTRTLELLWRGGPHGTGDRPARGRKPRITVDGIVAAAVAVADRDGIAAMSMPRVAESLGVGTMSLYTHVPGKAELIDLMVDAVLAERDLPRAGRPGGADWRSRVELYAERTLALHRRHPWLRQVSLVRPPLGPGLLAQEEFLIAALSGSGLPAAEIAPAAGAVAAAVDSAAGAEVEYAHAERAEGQSDDAWWAARASFWEHHFDPEGHPAIAALWQAGGLDRSAREAARAAGAFGLARLLDGIEARARAAAEPGAGPPR
ncbi:TetR/AcrR family transcriptional regulator [Streptomyces marincola]|uniref:TetR/AcrR family transcriptional regulator n=1 Tax=Streptomyces marincola TaxID=2878388 RepID=UPI001CF583E4|nr:TetR/AcrR family transcriptional regulator C-terminal domain-containing protein [Streptomyces marincola]UCM89033.1 TetR/AcrR family transcriptional regulator [Streptomyces marincola]